MTAVKCYTKKDAIRVLNDAIFACQRLYNISQLGLWGVVSDIASEGAAEIPENTKWPTEKAMMDDLKGTLGQMYCAAENDD